MIGEPIGGTQQQRLEHHRAKIVALVGAELAKVDGYTEERARVIARALYNDVSMEGAGPAVIIQQKASPLDLIPQVICLPGPLLLSFAARYNLREAEQGLASLGIK